MGVNERWRSANEQPLNRGMHLGEQPLGADRWPTGGEVRPAGGEVRSTGREVRPAGRGEPLLEIRNLKKYFSTPRGPLQAVDGVSFSIPRGVTLGVVGESGCGKSTLGRTILRLHEPTSGEILFKGDDITEYDSGSLKKLRAKMQMIFQDPYSSLNPRMTVSQAIAEPMILQGMFRRKDRAAIDLRVREMMNLVGLAQRFVNSYPHELDGGRRQRIGIARALALNPEFIVCDEPVSALDVSIQAQVLNLMQDLQEQFDLTYLFITHDLSVVKHLSEHIVVMYLGQLVERAAPEELFRHPMHPYTKALLSAIPIPDPDVRMERLVLMGELSSPVNVGEGCRFAKRCPYTEPECGQPQRQAELRPDHFVSCRRAGGLTE